MCPGPHRARYWRRRAESCLARRPCHPRGESAGRERDGRGRFEPVALAEAPAPCGPRRARGTGAACVPVTAGIGPERRGGASMRLKPSVVYPAPRGTSHRACEPVRHATGIESRDRGGRRRRPYPPDSMAPYPRPSPTFFPYASGRLGFTMRRSQPAGGCAFSLTSSGRAPTRVRDPCILPTTGSAMAGNRPLAPARLLVAARRRFGTGNGGGVREKRP